jgi:hypothetical protein
MVNSSAALSGPRMGMDAGCVSFRRWEGREGGCRTVLGVCLKVEMVYWIAHTADLAYRCCSGGMFNRCCECAFDEKQEWCEK